MDRRKFFQTALAKASEKVVEHVDRKVVGQAAHWIRPPFALPEFEFLLTCTRCGDCIDACPHEVIFALSARRGTRAAATPALDLLNKGCHLCSDLPCVTSCGVDALRRPDTGGEERPAVPKLAQASIDKNECLAYRGPECGACADSCPVPGALNWDMSRPRIDPEICVGCGLCREACIVEAKAVQIRSVYKDAADTDRETGEHQQL